MDVNLELYLKREEGWKNYKYNTICHANKCLVHVSAEVTL